MVVDSVGGVTHSLHVDQRQAGQCFVSVSLCEDKMKSPALPETGAAGKANRVVVIRVPGITHSLHVDQRQASQRFVLSLCENETTQLGCQLCLDWPAVCVIFV